MTKEELNKLVTIEDLEKFRERLIADVKTILNPPNEKEFYTPKEFSYKTGLKYSTVIYRCKVGKLQARQEDVNCSWQIYKAELARYIQEAKEMEVKSANTLLAGVATAKENISRTKMLDLLPNFPAEIQRGLLEGRLELVDSEHFFVKPVSSSRLSKD